MKMKQQSKWWLGLIIFGGLWGLFNLFFWGSKSQQVSLKQESTSKASIQNLTKVDTYSSHEKLNTQSSLSKQESKVVSFEQEFRREAEQISQVDPEPEKTATRLKSWALLLAKEDLKKLTDLALTTNSAGDDRALAVYVLSLSNRPESIENLGEIARKPIPENLNPRAKEFELVLRMQAVEGMTKPEQKTLSVAELQKTIQSSPEAWVVDRSQRALPSLNGKVASPAAQDQAALESLLRR